MTKASCTDALALLQIFLSEDAHYRDSSEASGAGGEAALDGARLRVLSIRGRHV